MIERRNTFTMEEFANSVNKFLEFNEYKVLPDNNKGSISSKMAKAKAAEEYEEFNKTQLIKSDFDELIEQTKHNKSEE